MYELNGRDLLGDRFVMKECTLAVHSPFFSLPLSLSLSPSRVIVEHSRGTSSGYGRRYGGGGDRYGDRGGRDRGGRGYVPLESEGGVVNK